MRARLPADIEVASAGLGALVGHPMDATAARVLLEHGVDGSAHRGQQVTAELLRKSDLILAMEKFQVASIVRTAPEVSGKVFLLGKWQGDAEIPDPYGEPRPVFDLAFRMIDKGVAGWQPYLKNR